MNLELIKNDKRFIKWAEFILQWECVYDKHGNVIVENDPSDSGRCTKYGIDQRSHPHLDIKNLTKDQALEIYWKEYWISTKANILPKGVGEIVANIDINCGEGHAIRWLQLAVGTPPDGIIGIETLKMIDVVPYAMICKRLLTRLVQYYTDIGVGHNARFVKGWLNRTDSLRMFINTL